MPGADPARTAAEHGRESVILHDDMRNFSTWSKPWPSRTLGELSRHWRTRSRLPFASSFPP